MTAGICLLAHSNMDRVSALAQFLSGQNIPIIIHIDQNTPDDEVLLLKKRLKNCTRILFADRKRSEWGTFDLLLASVDASYELIQTFQDVSHVSLISGGCLPVRPIHEFKDFLARNQGVDFVESFEVGKVNWIKGGLDQERFTLYHPFGWRTNRLAFDLSVKLQRRLGIKRKMPEHLTPHIGSQWWTLSRETLEKIVTDPLRKTHDRFFRRCWIPDEGYIQTLVRRHSTNLRCETLTLSEFDPQGKPYMFYDDHLDTLRNSGKFFARKIWRGADGLYSYFLSDRREEELEDADRQPESLPHLLETARHRRSRARVGILNQSAFPAAKYSRQPRSARGYTVFDGFDLLFSDFDTWLLKNTSNAVHGRLYKPDAVEFSNGEDFAKGAIPSNPKIRDWNPEQFLTNLIWNDLGQRQSFQFHVSDSTRMSSFTIRDENARIFMIEGAWMLALAQSLGEDEKAFKSRAIRLKFLEEKRLSEMALKSAKAEIYKWRLQDVLASPYTALHHIQKIEQSHKSSTFTVLPQMQVKVDLPALAHRLEGLGMIVPSFERVGEIRVPAKDGDLRELA